MSTHRPCRSGNCKTLIHGSVAVLCTTLIACTTPPSLYRWGTYEDALYTAYRNVDDPDPAAAAALLELDLYRSIDEGSVIPPGVRAHLGYLFYHAGRLEDALSLLEEERAAYPESTRFIDQLISRMEMS